MMQPAPYLHHHVRGVAWLLVVVAVVPVSFGAIQDAVHSTAAARKEQTASENGTPVPHPADQIEVKPVSHDEDIRNRLRRVLEATDWFDQPEVRVEEGVVFLSGRAQSQDLKTWAGDLARRTQDVVAVVNRMEVPEPSKWDMRPAWNGLLDLWRDIVRALPFVLFALFILALSAGAGVLATRGAKRFLHGRMSARIPRTVLATAIGVFVFLIGAYVVLRVAGLTQLALTIVGGTGLIGLALGIAFRDITENFLASIFLSMQHPFKTGDLIEVSDVTGYVQQLNMRTTVVMTFEGHLVQIPNASVYKNNIRNFTTNANRRDDFVVGIGYDDSITEAQEIARQVLADHPAVLDDPEPSVLADSLGKATVNLRVYFWINGQENSWLKVRSSVIRLVKRAFQERGISMPDEAREVVFPQGVPVTMHEANTAGPKGRPRKQQRSGGGGRDEAPECAPPEECDDPSTHAEAGLYSEAKVIEEQARHAQPVFSGENLLDASAGDDGNHQSSSRAKDSDR
jgi:small-conductance mechanosensitive channel